MKLKLKCTVNVADSTFTINPWLALSARQCDSLSKHGAEGPKLEHFNWSDSVANRA